MEQVIVTFIHNQRERDVRLPNRVESEKLVIALNEWLGHKYDWANGVHDLEYSFDQKHWFRLEKNQSLEDAGIWDGAFLRLSKDAVSTLQTEKEYEKTRSARKESPIEADEPEQLDYVWKVIE